MAPAVTAGCPGPAAPKQMGNVVDVSFTFHIGPGWFGKLLLLKK